MALLGDLAEAHAFQDRAALVRAPRGRRTYSAGPQQDAHDVFAGIVARADDQIVDHGQRREQADVLPGARQAETHPLVQRQAIEGLCHRV